MYSEDDLLPLSALQHLVFCERQCALIHIEQVWLENRYTAEGRVLHENVDAGTSETRGDVRVARSLALCSRRLGLSGRADAVELHRADAAQGGVDIPGITGRWRPYPVEYKRGKPKTDRCDEVQLCAQALCLEEMLGAKIAEGALFYGRRRRRTVVTFDADLRAFTEDAAGRLHRLFASRRTPPAERLPKCDKCSLLSVCLPGTPKGPVGRYLDSALARAARESAE